MPDKYRHVLIVTAGSLCAVLLHLYLDWQWGVLAGVGVGALARHRSWWYGGLACVAAWGALLGWNVVAAAGPTFRMAGAMGAFIGGVPGWIFFVMTLAVGFGLGAVGGLVGSQLRQLTRTVALPSSRTG